MSLNANPTLPAAGLRPAPPSANEGPRSGNSAADYLPIAGAVFMALAIGATMLLNDGRVTPLAIAFAVVAVIYNGIARPAISICWLIVYSAMEGFFKITTGFTQTVYMVKPALCVFLFVAWLLRAKQSGAKVRLPSSFAAIFLLLFWGIAEVFNPDSAGFSQAIAAHLVWYVTPALMLFVAYSELRDRKDLDRLQNVLIAIGVIASLLALLQFSMGRGWTEAHTPGYAKLLKAEWYVIQNGVSVASSFRPASTGSQGGGGALWAYLSIVPCLAALFTRPLATHQRLVLLAVTLIDLIGLLVSGVRLFVVIGLVDLALIVVLGGLSPSRIGRTLLAAILAVLVIYAGALVGETVSGGTLHYRYEDTFRDPVAKFGHDRGGNFTYLPEFLAQKPLGIGFQRGLSAGTEKFDTHVIIANRETEFNAVAADLGFPGLVLLLVVTVKLLLDGWTGMRSSGATTAVSYAMPYFVLFVGLVISYLAGPILQGGDFFWVIGGAMLAAGRLRAAGPTSSAAPS